MTRFLYIALVSILSVSALRGQDGVREIPVIASFCESFEITDTATTVSRPIQVDSTSEFTIRVLAASRTLEVSIISPDSTRYSYDDPNTATLRSGVFLIDSPPTTQGASYQITIVNPDPGVWTLEVAEPESINDPIDVVVTTFLNNDTVTILAGGGENYPIGADIRLAVVGFDGAAKIPGLTIDATLSLPAEPGFTPSAVTFRDDGTEGDDVADDSIFQAFVTPNQAGDFQVAVDVTGTSSTGSFRRTAATILKVVPRNAAISGFTDRGIDEDSDSFFDQIGITPTATVSKSGDFLVSVSLESSNGGKLQETTEATFTVGAAPAEVTFEADDIIAEFGVDGPYEVTEVRYYEELPDGDLVPADIVYDLGPTGVYTLAGLQHPPLSLAGEGTASGRDTNGTVAFNFLDISVPIFSDFGGLHFFSVSLIDKDGNELGFVSGSGNLDPGTSNLEIAVPGTPIGESGVDGPYFLSNLLLYRNADSLFVNRVLTPQELKASQFEGYVPPPTPPTPPTSRAGSTASSPVGASLMKKCKKLKKAIKKAKGDKLKQKRLKKKLKRCKAKVKKAM